MSQVGAPKSKGAFMNHVDMEGSTKGSQNVQKTVHMVYEWPQGSPLPQLWETNTIWLEKYPTMGLLVIQIDFGTDGDNS